MLLLTLSISPLNAQQVDMPADAASVDDGGRIDFKSLAADRGNLDRYVPWIASTSPTVHPGRCSDRASQLAFYINSYNALAMYNVLETGMPQTPDRFFSKVAFFVLRKLVVGGKPTSLCDYENDVIRPMGEPRVHFALNCMAISCPRLPGTPFTAAALEAELERETVRFSSQA
ncbi:MAG: hypothetical protein ACI8PT_002076, partial [Gammaproteobacteria bacterium]